jgi:hypothetical protein
MGQGKAFVACSFVEIKWKKHTQQIPTSSEWVQKSNRKIAKTKAKFS